jgi:hypothetical protein
MNRFLSRRHILRGVAGAFVAAPFLSSVWERAARAAGEAGAGTSGGTNPKQLIVMFTHYGCITNSFFPAKSHGALAASDLMGTTLAPLVPHVSKLLIPRGMRALNEWTANNNGAGQGRGQGNDSHTQIAGTYFTCQPVTPNSNNPFSFAQDTKFNAKPIATSLDHVIAQQVSPMGTPLFLRVGNSGGTAGESAQSNISYLLPAGSAAGTAANIYPGLGTPAQVFSALTGLFQSSSSTMTPTTKADYASVKGQSILDLVKDDLETLKRVDMSMADKNKLQAWEDLLTTASTGMGTGPGASKQCTQAVANMLGATQANVTTAGMGGLGSDTLTAKVGSSSLDGADMYSLMAVLAAMCNYNPVIFLKYPPNYTYTGLGCMEESHALSHRLNNAGMQGSCYPNAINLLLKIDAYYTQKFTNLIAWMDSIANGDGSTLLDSSACIWFNEDSDGNAHNLNNIPIVQAGSLGGYFKQGWTINVEDGSASLTQGRSMAQCADGTSNGMADGVSQGTGSDPNVANAPINKYYCNIMNAMGVKAGSDGFPSKGGTQPVTHFGYSDKTQDFAGGAGAVSGATIHNPGEWTALKA